MNLFAIYKINIYEGIKKYETDKEIDDLTTKLDTAWEKAYEAFKNLVKEIDETLIVD